MAEDSPFGVVMAKVAGVRFVSEVGELKSFLLVILGTVIGAGLSLFLASGVLTGIGAGAGRHRAKGWSLSDGGGSQGKRLHQEAAG